MKMISITQEEYDILTRIALLISDAKLAEYDDRFANQMAICPGGNRREAEQLVAEWERMK